MSPCLRSLRASREPVCSRGMTSSLIRSPAISAGQCSYLWMWRLIPSRTSGQSDRRIAEGSAATSRDGRSSCATSDRDADSVNEQEDAPRDEHVRSVRALARETSEELILAAEDAADGLVGEDVHDRLGEQAGDAEHRHVVRLLAGIDRHRVGDDDPADVRLGDLLERLVREERVRDEDVDLGRAVLACSACAPAISVPPVIDASSPMIATLALARGR